MVRITFSTGNLKYDEFAKEVNYILLQVQDLVNKYAEDDFKPYLSASPLRDSNGIPVGNLEIDNRGTREG